MNTWISKLSSRIYNDITSGLRGYHNTTTMPLELLEDEIVTTRLLIIKESLLKGILPKNDLLTSINCIPLDCKSVEKCSCLGLGTPELHFLIPLLILDYGESSIAYIGTIDRQTPFNFYISTLEYNMYHKYKRRKKQKPYVYIDITPNSEGMLDCYVFNAPLMKYISIVGIFKDPRLLCNFNDCIDTSGDNISWLEEEIQKRVVELKIRLYRLLQAPVLPNTLTPEV